MKIVWLFACGVGLLAGAIWLSDKAEAQTDKCRTAVEKVANQVEDPSNDEVTRLRRECPTEEGSIKNLLLYRNRVKYARKILAEARDILKTAVDELIKKPASTGQEGNQ